MENNRKISCYTSSPHTTFSVTDNGFHPNKSTKDILLQMSTSWHQSLVRGPGIFIIVLDIAGVFDRVWHSGLISKQRTPLPPPRLPEALVNQSNGKWTVLGRTLY